MMHHRKVGGCLSMSYVPAATERFTSEAEFPGGKRKWIFPCSAREDKKIPAVRAILILLLPNLAINLALTV